MHNQIYMAHHSRHMTKDEWDQWVKSPEGMLDILKYPVLAIPAPWQPYVREKK